jgi:hypothetical protein
MGRNCGRICSGSNCVSVCNYFYESERSKTLTMQFLVLYLPFRYQGVITMEEVRVILTLSRVESLE